MINIPLNQYWRLLARYLKPQRSKVFWLAFTLLSSIALQLLNPQILRYFIDTAIAGSSHPALFTAALLFISIAFLTQLFTVIATYFGETVAWTATNALRTDLTAHCLGLDGCGQNQLVRKQHYFSSIISGSKTNQYVLYYIEVCCSKTTSLLRISL